MIIAVIIAGVLLNFILYLSFGSLILSIPCKKEEGQTRLSVRLLVGFFFYYTVFFVFCVPVMKLYRPLSLLSLIWGVTVLSVTAVSAFINHRLWYEDIKGILKFIKENRLLFALMLLLVGIQVFLTVCSYNFTLDAAYYVAGVSTNVDTNMINVYDPFTGAWQDHFEMRYFFATYPVQDAVVCQIFKIPPLIWTKSVMALTIVILTNIVYYLIADKLNKKYRDDRDNGRSYTKAMALTLVMILFINLTFNTIYSSSVFLLTRTYEGKAIVGNLGIFFIFYLFILINDDEAFYGAWLSLFFACFGASTVSSTANMLLPVEITVLFVPYILRNRKYSKIPGYLFCVMPGIVFSLLFVLYVKGKFVFYTYPR
ncbi:MAG: hypothetical protein K5886_01895 [Lachnospiraceae bacterium]|nr:hypothetical protein [Lachnospiraceae bacterium]